MKTTRKRYVSFQLHQQGEPISEKALSTEIRRVLLSLFGEIVVADSKFYLTEYDEKSGSGILQCNAKSLEMVLASAVLIYSIGKTKVGFEPKRTSGTIKGLRK